MDIGERIRTRRKELNMTQNYLADKLGVTRSAISNWETGKNYPDLQIIVKLSEVMDISLDTLLKGDVNVVEKIAKDTKESRRLRRRAKVLTALVTVLIIVAGGLASLYFAVWHPTYMSYEESGIYIKDKSLMTNEKYYCFQAYDSYDNKMTFVYMTTTIYEKHNNDIEQGGRKLMDLNEYGRGVVRDDKGNTTVTDTITAVYYVPEDEAEKLNQEGGYWGLTPDENKKKLEHLISVSQLVWKAE